MGRLYEFKWFRFHFCVVCWKSLFLAVWFMLFQWLAVCVYKNTYHLIKEWEDFCKLHVHINVKSHIRLCTQNKRLFLSFSLRVCVCFLFLSFLFIFISMKLAVEHSAKSQKATITMPTPKNGTINKFYFNFIVDNYIIINYICAHLSIQTQRGEWANDALARVYISKKHKNGEHKGIERNLYNHLFA